ncbi:MAG: flagella synthesis protein FlgN [Cellvibrionaceae bacterium]
MNATIKNNRTIIQQLIKKDFEDCETLLTLLLQEREALSDRNYDRYAESIDAKTEALKSIEKNSEDRYALLHSYSLPPTEGQWKKLIESIDDQEIQNEWKNLIEKLNECKHENEINGKLISRGKQTLGKLLNILRGQLDSTQVYTHTGKTEGGDNSHTVTRA